jgi:hypothetical protein
MTGVPTSFPASASSDTRHSIAGTSPHGAALTVEVPKNPDDVFPLFLALIPFNIHIRPQVVHPHADWPKTQKPMLRWVTVSYYWLLISANATEP